MEDKTYNAGELLSKLKAIETLITENTNADGSVRFDSYSLMANLMLAERMVVVDEKDE